MKYYFLYVFLGLVLGASAQPSQKDLFLHNEQVALSKKENRAVASLDTLFCSGIPTAIIKVAQYNDNMLAERMLVVSMANADTLMEITYEYYGLSRSSKMPDVSNARFYFPDLKMACNVFPGPGNTYDNICKYGLINRQLLDTSKVETFVTLKGPVDINSEIQPEGHGLDDSRWVVLSRNTKAPLYFSNDSIGQDGQLIGTYEQATVAAPGGNLSHYTIFNVVGAITCIATATDSTEREWTLLTMKDKKYHPLKIRGKVSLVEIMQLLVNMAYL